MAVGMGKMFGFQFLENFQFPYVARSIRDFWRRWHISLSTWFRDYLYIPLGGNRASEGRTHLNLVIVFFVCGLWHGASWAFAVWGLYHGCFLVLERTRLGRLQEKLPGSLQHAYTILVVMMGWVLFRAETLASAGQYLLVMGGMGQPVASRLIFEFGTNQVFCAIILGIVFSGPSWSGLKRRGSRLIQGSPLGFRPALQAFGATADIALNATLLLVSVVWLAGGTYNPFIYFRF
jgi:alginate O-acetyltransferase complex protein AlgI